MEVRYFAKRKKVEQILISQMKWYEIQDLKAKTEAAAAQARAEAKAAEMERVAKAANADRHNITLYNECLNRYINQMRKLLNEMETYFNQSELQQIHNEAKSTSMSQVCERSAKCIRNHSMTLCCLSICIDFK